MRAQGAGYRVYDIRKAEDGEYHASVTLHLPSGTIATRHVKSSFDLYACADACEDTEAEYR